MFRNFLNKKKHMIQIHTPTKKKYILGCLLNSKHAHAPLSSQQLEAAQRCECSRTYSYLRFLCRPSFPEELLEKVSRICPKKILSVSICVGVCVCAHTYMLQLKPEPCLNPTECSTAELHCQPTLKSQANVACTLSRSASDAELESWQLFKKVQLLP